MHLLFWGHVHYQIPFHYPRLVNQLLITFELTGISKYGCFLVVLLTKKLEDLFSCKKLFQHYSPFLPHTAPLPQPLSVYCRILSYYSTTSLSSFANTPALLYQLHAYCQILIHSHSVLGPDTHQQSDHIRHRWLKLTLIGVIQQHVESCLTGCYAY